MKTTSARRGLPFLHAGLLACSLAVGWAPSQACAQSLSLGFATPAVQGSQNRTFIGPLVFSPSAMTFSNAVLQGASIVPGTNVVVTKLPDQVEVTRLPGTSGLVEVMLTGTSGSSSTSVTFQVVFVANQAPVLDALSPVTMNVNAATNLAFAFSDPDTPAGNLVLSASSSNTNLITVSSSDISGTGTNRTLALAPHAGQTGTATVTLGVSDGDTLATRTFVLTVQPVLAIDFTSPATNDSQSVTFAGLLTFAPQTMTFNAVILQGADIVPAANVQVSGSGADQKVELTRLPRTGGLVRVQLTGTSGSQSVTVTFDVFFETNQPPSLTCPATVTMDEDNTRNVSFTVGDPDTPLGNLTLNAISSNASLIPVSAANLSGTGTSRTLSLSPLTNENGTATIRLTVSDGETTTTNSFLLTVTPVNDPPVLTGGTGTVVLDKAATNLLPGVTVSDVDHNKPDPESVTATVEISDGFAALPGGALTYVTSGAPDAVTTALRSLLFTPFANLTPPGTTNTVSFTVTVSDGEFSPVYSRDAKVISVNDPPTATGGISPASVGEGFTVQPFYLTSISDPDAGSGDNLFTVSVQLVDPGQSDLGSFTSGTAVSNANFADVQTFLQNLGYTAASGVVTGISETVYFRYVVSDGYGGTVALTNALTILAQETAPNIFGVPIATANLKDAALPYTPFPTVSVSDPDEEGNQYVSATLLASNPALGTFSQTSFSLMHPADLTLALRAVTYTPVSGVLPINATSNTVLMIVVADVSGITITNNNVTLSIKAVNNPPQILGVPAAGMQPVLLPPVVPIEPFAGLALSNDDTNGIVVRITLDNTAKGSLTNLGGFVETTAGTYEMTGAITNLQPALNTLVYTLSDSYLFPVDDPGGTTFTLSASDFALQTSTRTLYIQVQDEPRNHLVTRVQNDGAPGCFAYALANAGNNDVITFALPSYPATVRLPGTEPTAIVRNVSIKGPGADLLTISGDGNGDLVPDRQLFLVASRVSMEGVTLARGTAAIGGAVQVQSGGALSLRDCAVVDSVASYYGGGIDVDGGQLALEGCFIGRNRLSSEVGFSGAGVSLFTDGECRFVNTTFAQNVQANENGDGGGALVVENRTSVTPQNTYLTHCTFAENEDASGAASAVLSVSEGTHVRPRFCIFRDLSGRNLDVGVGNFDSEGGNLCDDSSRTSLIQEGQTEGVFLLDHLTDLVNTDARLAPLAGPGNPTPYYPLLPDSPAVNRGAGSTWTLDQRGVLRAGFADSGAVEFNAFRRLTVNEISFDDTALNFIEIYVRRDSTPIDLAPYALYVDGLKVHEFSNSRIIGTNALFAAGAVASTLLNPGFGMVVAFSDTPVSITSDVNPTPVVKPSVTNIALGARSVITLGLGGALQPVSSTAYLGNYLDPSDGTNPLDTAGSSITLAPQFLGHAMVPHHTALPGPFGGADATVSPSANPRSPGSDAAGTPFGLDNAEPLALQNYFTLTEDDVGGFDVLSNDFDGDGNDRLVVVDVSAASEPGTGTAASAVSQLGAAVAVVPWGDPLRGTGLSYDPRDTVLFQQLPVGVEILDTFYYEIIDIGSAAVDGIGGGTSSNTWVTATHHRLRTGDSVTLSGVSVPAYNGEFAITVLDENTFAIPVTFTVAPEVSGRWETAEPRTPSSRSEAAVTVKVIGVNDAPVVTGDVVTNVTEASTVRIMARPELAGAVLSLSDDPVPPPAPNPAHLLDNDDDIDSDDTWQTLHLVGVLSEVHPILDYAGTPGESPVTVRAPAHGLASGAEILIANYGGHPSYNGYHTVTVLDADSFTLPGFFVDNDAAKGVWAVLGESNRYDAVTDVGATVRLSIRSNPQESHIIYDASTSAFLDGLAEGELYTNRFFQAVEDSHGAIGIGPIDVVVVGLNDTPAALPDPGGLGILSPLLNPSNTLADVLSDGLDILYTLPPASGSAGRLDVQALDRSAALGGTLVLPDLWSTDEDTPISIAADDLLANDSDIDRIDVLGVAGVEALSREGAALTLAGGQIVYDPAASDALQALAREESVIDTFRVTVSDSMTGGTVTSLVAVLVAGLNDTPVAQPDAVELSEDDVFTFNPMLCPADMPALHDYDLDIDGLPPDDRLTLIAVSNLVTAGQARVDLLPLQAQYDATVSALLNQLADWQDYTDSFEYTVTDNSFLFVMADEFYVPANTVNRALDVLANDRDFTATPSALTIADVGPTLNGGTVSVAPDGRRVVYSSPPGAAGDDFFRYVVTNGAGDRRSARVLVRSVVPPLNGILSAADDAYAVAYGETAVLDVLANDNMLPANGAGLTLSTNVVATSIPGQPLVSGNAFVYTATNGLGPLSFTYEVSAGGTSVARADVVVQVVDRRSTLKVQDDSFSVLAGSFDNELDVLRNDNLVTGATEHLRIVSLVEPAAFGTAALNAAATALVYTPAPGFIGVERLLYLATDTIGGTGTGTVFVAVGKIDTAIDFFTVAATTNAVSVPLDVLANDRVQPYAAGALTLVSVSPANTLIGTMQVNGAGARLDFVPSNAVGQVDFTYVVSDGSARTTTGLVTVATVPAGIYANTDRFLVRGGGSNYELDVLANDRSYPDINKSYSVIGIGTGADAPSAGGSVSIVGGRLSYTPAAGFFGQESFTYVMSDSVATDSARVTVSVRRGDLFANDDHFAVFYELEDGGPAAKAFTLPVVLNDRIQPPLDQVIQITGLGVGTNAPSHSGAVSVGADGVSLVYRPAVAPATSHVERFTYEISDGTERRASAAVEIQVFNRESKLEALTQDDAFTVARNSSGNVLPLLRNDFVKPGTAAGWRITGVSATGHGGAVSISGANVLYSPADGFVGVDTFTYSVNDGLGGTGSAAVRVRVGAQPTMPDLFAALSGSGPYSLDVVANDALSDDYAGEYALAHAFGTTHGGSVGLSPSNTVLYTPYASYTGPYPYTETFFYTVSDDASGAVTGTVRVTVHETGSDRSTTAVTVHVTGRNDIPVILNDPVNAPLTDKGTARPFTGMTLVEVDQQTLEPVDVLVWLDDAAKGTLRELGGFAELGGGRYGLSGVTAAYATAQIRNLLFVPTENRITVPTAETTTFTVQVTDNKSAPVADAQTAIAVTAVNDSPVILGTRSGQTVYAATPIRMFSSVTIREVDDLTLQPLDVTVRLSDPSRGLLRNLGSFVPLSNGVYVATGITAAAATQQLRLMEFLYGAYSVQPGAPQLTVFSISVDDRFAAPVVDDITSVWAYSAYEDTVQPESAVLQRSFGFAVDTASDFAVVGAPSAAVNGTDSGSALVYRLVPGTTNSWELWRQLQPGAVDASDKFGHSVAISDDLIAVGAIQDEVGSSAVGTVYLFQRDLGGSNNWGQLIRIAPTNLPAASQFGFAVDLDGDLLAVGAPKATAAGAVLLFGRNKGGANAWGEIKRWEPAGQTSTACGTSVSVSGDYLVAGAPKNITGLAAGTPLGAAYFLSRHAGGTDNWGLVQRLVASNLTTTSDFGYCVSVDRDLLAVGAPKVDLGNSEMGQVFVYWKAAASNGWTEVSRLDERGDQGAHFGYSLSVNKDFVFIGAPGWGNTNSVYAYLYRHDALDVGTWRRVERLVCPAGPQSLFPPSCAVSFKRDAAIVGVTDNALSPYGYTGKAHMYRFKFNNAPAVAAPVADQFAEWNEPFAYTLPDGIFADPDVGDTLAVHAALPVAGSGLSVAGMTVSGTPTVIGPVPVEVTATDESGAGALDTFDVIVRVDGVPLAATPRNLWDLEHFGKAVANPALESTLWGGFANADGDAANNDREYAFGGDPTVGDACGLVLLSPAADGNMVITYVRRRDDPALTYTVQGTVTLAPPAWVDVQTWVLDEQAAVIDDAYEQVAVTVDVSAAGPAMFFRVIVAP